MKKNFTSDPVQLYAVGVRFGLNGQGNKWASLIISKDKDSTRSPYSSFIRAEEYDEFHISDADFDGLKANESSAKVFVRESLDAVSVGKGIVGTIEFAPCKQESKTRPGTYYRVSSQYICALERFGEDANALAEQAVMRTYANAEIFYKDPKNVDDYRRYKGIEIDEDALEKFLFPEEDED